MAEERLPFPEDSAKPQGAERRTSIRYLCGLVTTCSLSASMEGGAIQARIRNISAGGISLIVNRSLEPETVVQVRLANRAKMFSCTLPIRIIYAVEHPGGECILGASFDRPLTQEELRHLLG